MCRRENVANSSGSILKILELVPKLSQDFSRKINTFLSKMPMEYGNSIYCYLYTYYLYCVITFTMILIRLYRLYYE